MDHHETLLQPRWPFPGLSDDICISWANSGCTSLLRATYEAEAFRRPLFLGPTGQRPGTRQAWNRTRTSEPANCGGLRSQAFSLRPDRFPIRFGPIHVRSGGAAGGQCALLANSCQLRICDDSTISPTTLELCFVHLPTHTHTQHASIERLSLQSFGFFKLEKDKPPLASELGQRLAIVC